MDEKWSIKATGPLVVTYPSGKVLVIPRWRLWLAERFGWAVKLNLRQH